MDKKTNVTMENFFDSLVGHKIAFDLSIIKDGNLWVGEGKIVAGGSLDNEAYGYAEKTVKTYDKDTNSVIATLVMSIGSYLSSEEFQKDLYESVKNTLIDE